MLFSYVEIPLFLALSRGKYRRGDRPKKLNIY
jgi:hypothetical protein